MMQDTEAGESYTSSSDEAWVFDFSGYSESEVQLWLLNFLPRCCRDYFSKESKVRAFELELR